MKDKKDKRKHHESTIGKIIYGFLLFAPLLAILTTCLYVTFNKNAYESYVTTDTEYQNVTVDNKSQFVKNETYYFNCARFFEQSLNAQETGYIKYTQLNLDINSLGFQTIVNPNQFNIRHYYNDLRIKLKNDNGDTEEKVLYPTNRNITQFNFKFDSYLGDSNNYIDYAFYYIKEFKTPLNNVFYSSINKVEESNLFNWSKNTAIYTVLNNTSNTLGITNTFWPMLMAYWLIISVIYILYDIVLMMLVIFHRKVHCLQDSI